MIRLVLLAMTVAIVGAAARGQAACAAVAEGSSDYDRATRVVLQLPEVKTWAKSHSFPVAFMPVVDKQKPIARRCFWSVTVYASRPERMDLWHSFFVEVGGTKVMVMNLEGEPISLAQWRKERRR